MKREWRTVHRYGKSLAVTLPTRVCREVGIKKGDAIAFYDGNEGAFVMAKVALAEEVSGGKDAKRKRSNRRA